MKYYSFLLGLSLLFINGCNTYECPNTDTTFIANSPGSEVYKKELIKQIEASNPLKLSYVFNGYIERDGKEYMNLLIAGDSFCAQGLLLVEHWDNTISNIKRTKGKGYKGAELAGLEMEIRETEMIYERADRIID